MASSRFSLVTLTALVVVSVAGSARAESDKVTLVRGKEPILGKISKDERDGLEIEVRDSRAGGAKRTFNSAEIADVEWDISDADANEGIKEYRSGSYSRAAESLLAIVGTKESLDRIRPIVRPYLLYVYAESLLRSGKPGPAYAAYQSLIENYKTSRYAPIALTNMAEAAIQSKAFDKLPPLLALMRETGGEQKQRADYYEGEALLVQGKPRDALSKYSSAASGSNVAVKGLANVGLARAQAAAGDYAKARDAAQAALLGALAPEQAAEAHAIIGDAILADAESKKSAGAALQDALLDAALEYLRVQNQYSARADTEARATVRAGECFQKLSTLPTRAGMDDRERALTLYNKISGDRRFAGGEYANKAFHHMEEMK